MELLWGYGLGPNLARLLAPHWGRQHMVPKAGQFLGKAFITGSGVIQGEPTFPMIFNIMVDEVVRDVLEELCGPKESQFCWGWAAEEQNILFYADGGRIVGQDHIWVQDALIVTVAMFCWMGLEDNLEKNKLMMCTPGFIWGRLSEKVYKQRATEEGHSFWEQKQTWVSYTQCGFMVATSLLKINMERQHILISPQKLRVN